VGRIGDFSGGGHGALHLESDLDQALRASCNVFFATLATAVGVEPFRAVMERAELSDTPAADELAPYLAEAGFGQVVVKAAPIELAMIAAAVGVAGEDEGRHGAARPHWVEAVQQGERRRRPAAMSGTRSDEPYRPFDPTVARRLREMMLGVVNEPGGTAYAAFHRDRAFRLPGVTVGGKTGTAEFEKRVTVNGKASKAMGTHAWFIGFARTEREVEPRTLAFAVLVEDVRGRQSTGGRICAPLARNLLIDLLGPFPEPEPLFEAPPAPRRPWWEWFNPRRWF
jgi:peptidoglycan glycosyltransferase